MSQTPPPPPSTGLGSESAALKLQSVQAKQAREFEEDTRAELGRSVMDLDLPSDQPPVEPDTAPVPQPDTTALLGKQVEGLSREKADLEKRVDDVERKFRIFRDENEHHRADIQDLSDNVEGYLHSQKKPNKHHLMTLRNMMTRILLRKSSG